MKMHRYYWKKCFTEYYKKIFKRKWFFLEKYTKPLLSKQNMTRRKKIRKKWLLKEGTVRKMLFLVMQQRLICLITLTRRKCGKRKYIPKTKNIINSLSNLAKKM
ncbi:hypothetical protein DMUE_2690 [Dictyocoela muelleri]|nr:hypothetical protein DMUE_2690 [Dictyocoela muelleri]